MKKVFFVLGIILSGKTFCSDAIQGLKHDISLLGEELNALDNDFVQGVLILDASEKDMNSFILPIFNWFSGISTTNKKDPATITQSDFDNYNELFKKYLKVYGVNNQFYNYYAFGQQLLMVLVAVNAIKSDAFRLGVTTDADVISGKLSLSDLADAQACITAFSEYDAFVKKMASYHFNKPFSSLLSDIYAKELAIAQKIILLKNEIVSSAKLQPQKPKPLIPVKSSEEVVMDGILNPLLSAFSGSDVGATDPDDFSSKQAQTYQKAFVEYVKKEGTDKANYLTYKFGLVLLPALAAKNVLEADLLSLGAGEPDDLDVTQIKPTLVANAQDFIQSFDALQAFLSAAPSSFKSPLPVHLVSYYQELVPFAVRINLLASKKTTQPVASNPIAETLPVSVVTSANTFIMQNFSDKNLSTLSLDQINVLIANFLATFDSSDAYYTEYKVWAAYVPVRYRQLDLLNKLENNEGASVILTAANAFRINYLNGFRPVYLSEMNIVREPYASQLHAVSLEFAVTDALARLELQKIQNNTFSI